MVFECLARFEVMFTMLSTAVLAKEKCFVKSDDVRRGRKAKFRHGQLQAAQASMG